MPGQHAKGIAGSIADSQQQSWWCVLLMVYDYTGQLIVLYRNIMQSAAPVKLTSLLGKVGADA
jgi:hypothetical protein